METEAIHRGEPFSKILHDKYFNLPTSIVRMQFHVHSFICRRNTNLTVVFSTGFRVIFDLHCAGAFHLGDQCFNVAV
ncbi:hypothetical protein RB195_000133 [Necator americanus]|uniref:Uncharacterized protein n=1 Tax=Necator americanus TaxID=51031 RepID=A0ABR1D838_NECAM